MGFVPHRFTIKENITANEVVDLEVGALVLAATLATPKVDAFIAQVQRRDLKLCTDCGGVTRIPCARCKARSHNIFSFDGSSKPNNVSCMQRQRQFSMSILLRE